MTHTSIENVWICVLNTQRFMALNDWRYSLLRFQRTTTWMQQETAPLGSNLSIYCCYIISRYCDSSLSWTDLRLGCEANLYHTMSKNSCVVLCGVVGWYSLVPCVESDLTSFVLLSSIIQYCLSSDRSVSVYWHVDWQEGRPSGHKPILPDCEHPLRLLFTRQWWADSNNIIELEKWFQRICGIDQFFLCVMNEILKLFRLILKIRPLYNEKTHQNHNTITWNLI